MSLIKEDEEEFIKAVSNLITKYSPNPIAFYYGEMERGKSFDEIVAYFKTCTEINKKRYKEE